MKEFVRDSK